MDENLFYFNFKNRNCALKKINCICNNNICRPSRIRSSIDHELGNPRHRICRAFASHCESTQQIRHIWSKRTSHQLCHRPSRLVVVEGECWLVIGLPVRILWSKTRREATLHSFFRWLSSLEQRSLLFTNIIFNSASASAVEPS